MENTELIEFLNSSLGKKAIIKNSGFITSKIIIEKLEYEINYGILALKDKATDNYTILDLQNINEINIEKNEVVIHLYCNIGVDVDVTITIQ